MDWIALRDQSRAFIKKYRHAILIVLLGLVLMAIPARKEESQENEVTETLCSLIESDAQTQLEEILSQIKGAGKVQVLLTEARGEETIYQSNEDTDIGDQSNSIRQDTVLITGSDRQQQGLVRQVNPPSYQGAIVVCQGADNASVRLAIVEAVSSVTGLGADHISVLKMK